MMMNKRVLNNNTKSSLPKSSLVTCIYLALSAVPIEAFTSYGQSSWNGLLLSKPYSPVVRNRLNYQHEDALDGQIRTLEHVDAVDSVTSKSSLNTMNTPEPDSEADLSLEEQCDLDNYLTFLNRRHHRLHDDGVEPTRNNALFVLGVAKMASQRLLHPQYPTTDGIDIAPSQVNVPGASIRKGNNVLPYIRQISAGTSIIPRINYRSIARFFKEKCLNKIIGLVQLSLVLMSFISLS